MTQSGEMSIEKAPYNKDLEVVGGACPVPPSPEDLVCPVELSEAEVSGELERSAEPSEELLEKEETKDEEEREKKRGVTFRIAEVDVRLRRHPPSRSQTVVNRLPRRSVDLRRQSLCNLKKGETGELGSKNFRRALQRDSMHEVHPGWESIRKLSKVVG